LKGIPNRSKRTESSHRIGILHEEYHYALTACDGCAIVTSIESLIKELTSVKYSASRLDYISSRSNKAKRNAIAEASGVSIEPTLMNDAIGRFSVSSHD